jgi:hypothetical protein
MATSRFLSALAAAPLQPKSTRLLVAGVASVLCGATGAAQISYTVPISGFTGYSLTGSAIVATLAIPKFDGTLGLFDSVSFSHTNNFAVDALSNAQGGIFLPPFYVDSWSWATVSSFWLTGPGFSIPASSLLKSGGSGNYAFTHSASVNTTGSNVSSTAVITTANPDALSYLGTGIVPITFIGGITTAVTPLPATPGGFTWLFSTITGAGVAQASESIATITYRYTPFAPVPEPASILTHLAGGLFLAAYLRRRMVGLQSC